MITSFKLPDLVLGVNIRADVRGAKAAARQLRNAVASEFARAGGMGMGGGGGGGNGLQSGAVAGLLAGSLAGNIAGNALASVEALRQKARKMRLSTTEWARGKTAKEVFGSARWAKTKAASDAAWEAAVNLRSSWDAAGITGGGASGGMRAGTGRGRWKNTYEQATSMGMVYNRSIKVWVPETEKALKKATAKATQVGLLQGLKKALRLWHFLIGGLIIGTVVGGAKRMMGPALQYIRATGTTTGRYGRFSNAMEATPAALRNVSVQFGLMAIQLLNLGEALQDFNRILVQLGSVLGWLGEQKWLMWFIKGNPNLVLTRLANWALGKLPTGAGGVNLGAGGGLTGQMAPAALQGSVQAYSILQGNLMNYALQTARNTKQTVDALNKIIERAPAMGVVNP